MKVIRPKISSRIQEARESAKGEVQRTIHRMQRQRTQNSATASSLDFEYPASGKVTSRRCHIASRTLGLINVTRWRLQPSKELDPMVRRHERGRSFGFTYPSVPAIGCRQPLADNLAFASPEHPETKKETQGEQSRCARKSNLVSVVLTRD